MDDLELEQALIEIADNEIEYEDTFVCAACGGTYVLPAIRIWGDRDPNDEIALCHDCFQAIAGELV